MREVMQAAPFIQRFKTRLRERMEREAGWKPGMSQEDAAQHLILQTAYNNVLAELERLVAISTESDDG